jgi:hypothetical protein
MVTPLSPDRKRLVLGYTSPVPEKLILAKDKNVTSRWYNSIKVNHRLRR